MFFKKYKLNFNDKILIAIIAIQLFGLYGGAFQPVRLLCIGVLFLGNIKKSVIQTYRYEISFLLFFFVYGVFSIPFSEDPGQAIYSITYLAVHFLIILAMIFVSDKAINPVISVIIGWLIFIMFSLPFAIFEIITDWHFSNSKFEGDMLINVYGTGVAKNFASFTFGNFNYYNLLLTYSLPFLMSSFFIFKNKKQKVLLYSSLIGISFVVLSNGSRGALLCLLIIFIYFLKSNIVKFNIGKIIMPLFFMFFLVKFLTEQGSFLTSIILKSDRMFEDASRVNLLSKGFELFIDSFLLGVGPGNLGVMYTNVYGMTLIAPHNLFLEILVEYGILVFLGFVLLLVKIYKRKKQLNGYSKFIIYGTFVLLPFSSLINSLYLLTPNLWVLIGSLLIISNINYKNK